MPSGTWPGRARRSRERFRSRLRARYDGSLLRTERLWRRTSVPDYTLISRASISSVKIWASLILSTVSQTRSTSSCNALASISRRLRSFASSMVKICSISCVLVPRGFLGYHGPCHHKNFWAVPGDIVLQIADLENEEPFERSDTDSFDSGAASSTAKLGVLDDRRNLHDHFAYPKA